MAVRFYLAPVVVVNTRFRVPQFIDGTVPSYATQAYGDEPVMLVAADVTPAQHTAIAAHPEVGVFPADLSQTIGANLATVQATLEGFNIPAGFVTSGMTFKALVRWIARLCFFSQAFAGDYLGGRLFPAGITLNSTVGDLSQGVRQAMQNAATHFGISFAAVTLTTTIRAALKILADQLPDVPTLAGVSL